MNTKNNVYRFWIKLVTSLGLLLMLFSLSVSASNSTAIAPNETQGKSGLSSDIINDGDRSPSQDDQGEEGTPPEEGEEETQPSEEPEPTVEAAPITTTKGEPIFDAETIVLDKIRLAPEPVEFIPVNNLTEVANFDGGIWQNDPDISSNPISIAYKSNYATEGNQAMEVTVPLSADGSINTAGWTKKVSLDTPWINVDFITVDAFIEERIATMPNLLLNLKSVDGGSLRLEPVDIDKLRQWDNRQITYSLADVPAEYLAALDEVGFVLTDYSDGAYGTPLEEIHIHLDNLRLNGGQIWDHFEWTGFEFMNEGQNITEIGWSNSGFENSAGALTFSWQVDDESTSAIASISTTSPQDWSGHTFIRTQLLSIDGTAPVSLTLYDGNSTISTEQSNVSIAGIWNQMVWTIPDDSDFDLSNIVQLDINVDNLAELPSGRLFIDQIELGQSILSPFDVAVQTGGDGLNTIKWENPVQSDADTIVVRAAINNFATRVGKGSIICEVPITGFSGTCQHENIDASLNYYYTVIALKGESEVFTPGISQGVSRRNRYTFAFPGGAYQIGLNPHNGSIETMSHNGIPTLLSGETPLWEAEFNQSGRPNELTTLDSTQFNSDSENALFSINTAQNAFIYKYKQDNQELKLTVFFRPISQTTFDFRLLIENRTGQSIRKLRMPELGFNVDSLSEVIVPTYEGAALLPPFFATQRQTYIERPELMANFVYVNFADNRNVALYTIQDNFARSDALANHNPDTPMYQPTNILLTGTGTEGLMQLEILAEIKSGETWQSATNRVVYNQPFPDILSRYVLESQFTGVNKLATKGLGYQTFSNLAYGPLIHVDMEKVAESVEEDLTSWEEVATNLLNESPQKAILQFSSWNQQAAAVTDAAGEAIPQPDGETIWFDQYGPPDTFLEMLDTINQTGRLTLPTVQWTTLNEIDLETGEPIPDTDVVDRLVSTRPEIPVKAEEAVVLKPWADSTIANANAIINQYQTQYPAELLYFGMSGNENVQYTYFDESFRDGTYSGYTQSIIDETNRVSGQMPIFVNDLFAPLSKSAVGFHGSLQQYPEKFVHWGDMFGYWHPYPLAATMMHDEVAFYPDLENGTALPTDSTELFTYYTTFGYNLAGQIDPITPNANNDMRLLQAFQAAVNSRTFGRVMPFHRYISEDRSKVETIWGGSLDTINVIANFDPTDSGETYAVGDYTIAPDGFMVYSVTDDLTAGVFEGIFNGEPLSPGDHWIIVEYGEEITVQQPRGDETELSIVRPQTWRIDNLIDVKQILADGTIVKIDALGLSEGKISFYYSQLNGDVPVDSYLFSYGVRDYSPSEQVLLVDPAEIKTQPSRSSTDATSSEESTDDSAAEPSTEDEETGEQSEEEQEGSSNPADGGALVWAEDGVLLNSQEDGSLLLTESNVDGPAGAVGSNRFEINFDESPVVELSVREISDEGRFNLILVNQGGLPQTIASGDSPVDVTINLQQETELEGMQEVQLFFELVGEASTVTVDIAVR